MNQLLKYYTKRVKLASQRQYARIVGQAHAEDRPSVAEYGSQQVIQDAQQASDTIYEKLTSGVPCMFARFGSTQLAVMANWVQMQKVSQANPIHKLHYQALGYKRTMQAYNTKNMCIYGGFFPNDPECIERYIHEYLAVLPQIDVHGVWHLPMEDYFTKTYFPKAAIVRLRYLEPFFTENPWTRYLEGKRVLVIHPFADTIQHQFEQKRELLFANTKVLPPFDLRLIKAVQSRGENEVPYDTWFQAFEWMCEEMGKAPFDIAIIGAGAYGMRLAAHAKSLGAHGFHFGGPTQLLFGIKGKRWEENPDYQFLLNEHWVKAGTHETKGKYHKREDGAYW